MRTILVTGGAGFIGSHITLFLLERGFKVIVFDSFVNSSDKSLRAILNILKQTYPSFQDNLFVHKGDLRNKSVLKICLKHI